AHSVLIAGAGGGFDVYAGLPLVVALWDSGVDVYLANLSFTQLELLNRDAWTAENVAAVAPDTIGPEDYFPERALARWLATHELPSSVRLPCPSRQGTAPRVGDVRVSRHAEAQIAVDRLGEQGTCDIAVTGCQRSAKMEQPFRSSRSGDTGLVPFCKQ